MVKKGSFGGFIPNSKCKFETNTTIPIHAVDRPSSNERNFEKLNNSISLSFSLFVCLIDYKIG